MNTKSFLNIAIGISIILCSFSLLVLSIEHATAKPIPPDYKAVGVVTLREKAIVVGYSNGHVTGLGSIDVSQLINSAESIKAK